MYIEYTHYIITLDILHYHTTLHTTLSHDITHSIYYITHDIFTRHYTLHYTLDILHYITHSIYTSTLRVIVAGILDERREKLRNVCRAQVLEILEQFIKGADTNAPVRRDGRLCTKHAYVDVLTCIYRCISSCYAWMCSIYRISYVSHVLHHTIFII